MLNLSDYFNIFELEGITLLKRGSDSKELEAVIGKILSLLESNSVCKLGGEFQNYYNYIFF